MDDAIAPGAGDPRRDSDADAQAGDPRALILGEQAFRTLFGQAPIGIALVATRERRILDSNEEYARILGRTIEETRGLDWADFTHPDDLAVSLDNLDLWLAEGRRESALVQKRYLRPDGSVVIIRLSSAAVDTAWPDQPMHLSMIEDITERTLAAEQLAESERRYRLLADHAGDVMVLFHDGRMEWVAPSITTLLGYAPDELQGRLGLDLIHPDDHRVVLEHRKLLLHGQPIRVRARFLHADGHPVWLEYTSRPLQDDDGTFTGSAVSTLWNVQAEVDAREALAAAEQERRALEASMQRATRLESIGVLAGGVAHDFNNILAGILGNTELALAQLDPASPLGPLLRNVASSAMRASELTRQLLDYAGHRPFDRGSPADPAAVISETMELVATLLPGSAVVEVDLPRSLPLVACDGGQLQQIVMNLVINASDALESQRGHVRVRARLDRLDEAAARRLAPDDPPPPGEFVAISVSDDGVGMDEAVATRVFEPFFTTKPDGRGLGLAAVYGIARSSGGSVAVESERGRGTTITVHLPTVAAPDETGGAHSVAGDSGTDAAAAAAAAADAARRDTLTVLVVDDDDGVREVCSMMLEVAGCTVVACADGHAAIAAVDERLGEIDVVLVDMSMPVMSGAEVLRAIRGLAPRLPAVLMSGFSAVNLEEVLGEVHVQGFLQKPFRPDVLVATVRNAAASMV